MYVGAFPVVRNARHPRDGEITPQATRAARAAATPRRRPAEAAPLFVLIGTVEDLMPITVRAASPSGADARSLLSAYFAELISRYQQRPGPR